MPINTLTFDQITANQVTSMQGLTPDLQFPVGSVNLALVESNSGVALWLQGVMLQIAALSRASSCTGTDLDSWMADYNFYRNGSQAASGLVNFARATPTLQAVVPVGALVQTTVGDIQFTVYADTSNPNFNISLNGYVLAPTVSSISVPVRCSTSGIIGNVNPNTINQISTPITGVDTVNNPGAFSNGYDKESDSSFRARFIIYINSLSQATLLAYENAITSGTPAVFYNIAENTNYSTGSELLGFVSVIVDDGSGNPPTSFLNLISQKINNTRALGIRFGVYPPVILNATITVDVSIDPSYNQQTVIASITNAVALYISNLNISKPIIYTKLYSIIYNSYPDAILEVSNLFLNGVQTDLIATFKQRIFLSSLTVTSV